MGTYTVVLDSEIAGSCAAVGMGGDEQRPDLGRREYGVGVPLLLAEPVALELVVEQLARVANGDGVGRRGRAGRNGDADRMQSAR